MPQPLRQLIEVGAFRSEELEQQAMPINRIVGQLAVTQPSPDVRTRSLQKEFARLDELHSFFEIQNLPSR